MHIYVYLSCFFRDNRVRTLPFLLPRRFLSSQYFENVVLLRSLAHRSSLVRLDNRQNNSNNQQSIHCFSR